MDMQSEQLFIVGQYPDRLSVPVALGFKDEAKRLAAREGLSLGEFVRRALQAQIAKREVGRAHA